MIMAVAALAIDMMLPAFGAMRSEFGLAIDSNALAPMVTFFLLGLGFGQPVWGPLSDALGRKRILYLGLGVYALGSIGAAFAPNLGVLFALRFVAGAGAAGPRVVANGIVRDAYEGQTMAKVMSYVMAVFIAVPVAAPALGSLVLTIGSWHMIFWIFAFFALGVGLWSTRLPETLPPSRRIPLNARKLLEATTSVLRNRFTMALTLAQTAVFGFFSSYLASSQLIIDDVFGLDAWFPIIFGGSAAVLGIGMLLNTRLLNVLTLRTVLRFTIALYTVAAFMFAAIAWISGGTPPFWLFLAGLMPILLCHALLIPNFNAAAMIPMGEVAGTASAVIGTVSILGGASIGAAVDLAYNGTIIPLATAAAVGCTLAFVFYVWADRGWESATQSTEPVDTPSNR
jgi:DHA1 family bicyclomycin/chloramphenicol resistance-like MFS transporter